ADRRGDDGHAATRLRVVGADAAEPAPGLDPVARTVQSRRVGGRSGPLGHTVTGPLEPDPHPRRLPRPAPRRECSLRNARLPGLSTLDLTKGGTAMPIAALPWPAAAVWIALIVSLGLVVAVLAWSIFRTGQAAIRSESRKQPG